MGDDGRLSIYISSTYSDLAEYRRATHDALRQMGHDVRAMEDYIARDDRPLDVCLRDVRSCELYVGIFGWRYGFVPPHDNPEHLSMTQLEFKAARANGVPCLIFMLAEESPWPPSLMDAKTGESDHGSRIDALRATLAETYLASYFGSPQQLASQVGIAVAAHAQQKVAVRAATIAPEVALPDELADTRRLHFETTLLPDIAARIRTLLESAESDKLVEVDFGQGNTWWSTRLFLLSALVDDFTDIEQFVILGADQEFLGMATPAAVRRALTGHYPTLANAYGSAAAQVEAGGLDRPSAAVDAIVTGFNTALGGLGGSEESIKTDVGTAQIQDWLGAELARDPVERDGQPLGPAIYRQILNRRSSLVPVTDNYRLDLVVDRHSLARDIALGVLNRSL